MVPDAVLAQALLSRGLVDEAWLVHARAALEREPGLTLIGLIQRHQAIPADRLAALLAELDTGSGARPRSDSRPPVIPVDSLRPPSGSGSASGSGPGSASGLAHSDYGSASASRARRSTSRPGGKLEPGDELGGYVITRELGRGGMGIVFEARQPGLDRRVAIKVLLSPAGPGAETARERFELEGRAMARLHHPHILRVLDVGETEPEPGATGPGRLFLVTELAAGGSLADRLERDGELEFEEACELARKVAEALEHAHVRGIVHRDVKPDNILLSEDGEPLLTDFGLAKALDAAGPGLSRSGHMLGTAHYMPPEQLEGRGLIDGRADVYALGATLFELLAGRPPFDDSSRDSLMVAILMRPAPRISKSAANIPRELDLVLERCLAKDPEDRYDSAAELAEDLRRLVAGEPVAARALSPLVRFRLWRRRNPAGALLAAALLLIAAIAPPVYLLDRQRRAVAEARERARLRAESQARVQKRFNDVRELARALLFEVHDAIEGLPGATKARRLIVERSLGYLDRIEADAGDDVELLRELAESHERVASVLSDGIQRSGEPSTRALAQIDQAIRLRDRVLELSDTPADRFERARLRFVRGQELRVAGRHEDARALAEPGLGEAVGLPEAAVLRLKAARAGLLAELAIDAGKHREGEAAFRESREALTALVRTDPPDRVEIETGIDAIDARRIPALAGQGRFKDAEALARESMTRLQALTKAQPESLAIKLRFAAILAEAGELYLGQYESARAMSYLFRALTVLKPLAAADPANQRLNARVLQIRVELANASYRHGDQKSAYAMATECLDELARRLLLDPGNRKLRESRLRALSIGAVAALDGGHLDQSIGWTEQAMQERARLEPDDSDPEELADLAQLINVRASALRRQGKPGDDSELKEVLERVAKQRVRFPRNHSLLNAELTLLQSLAINAELTGRSDDAKGHLERVVALTDRDEGGSVQLFLINVSARVRLALRARPAPPPEDVEAILAPVLPRLIKASKDPDVSLECYRLLAQTQSLLGHARFRLGRRGEGIELQTAGFNVIRSVVGERRRSISIRDEAAIMGRRLRGDLVAAKCYREAATIAKHEMALFEGLLKLDKSSVPAARGRAAAGLNRTWMSLKAGQTKEAEAALARTLPTIRAWFELDPVTPRKVGTLARNMMGIANGLKGRAVAAEGLELVGELVDRTVKPGQPEPASLTLLRSALLAVESQVRVGEAKRALVPRLEAAIAKLDALIKREGAKAEGHVYAVALVCQRVLLARSPDERRRWLRRARSTVERFRRAHPGGRGLKTSDGQVRGLEERFKAEAAGADGEGS